MKTRGRQGSAMLEAALSLGIVLYTAFVIIDFGVLMFARNQMPYLAAEGARWAAVRGSTSGAATDSPAITTFVRSRAAGLATNNLTVNVTYPGGNSPGSDVVVQVSYPVTPLTMFPLTTTTTVTGTARLQISQ